MLLKSCIALQALATAALAQKCPLQFDGRVPVGSTPASFDANTSLFGTKNVLGANLAFSKLILLPSIAGSLFDGTASIPLEVTISDASIFNQQTGFRRAELNPASNSGTDPSTQGIKTLHFSVRKDNARALNISHEYQLVFLEDAKFSTNQFVLKTGMIAGQPAGQSADLLVLQGNVNAPVIQNLFTTPFTANVFHNFALTLDFTANTVQTFYSQNAAPLASVTAAISNDLSGQGEFHFGVLKKGTGVGLTDVTKQGFQESGINEGVVYGGIFEEDSTGACVSLSP